MIDEYKAKMVNYAQMEASFTQLETGLKAVQERLAEQQMNVAEIAAERQEEEDVHHHQSVFLEGEMHELKRQLEEVDTLSIDLGAKV